MKRLLIVDDEPAIGRLVRRVAEGCGFEVDVATSSEEFMKMWAARGAEAIVLDLSLPGTDGVELLRFLAASNCRATILIISGFDPRVLETAANLAGARGLNIAGTIRKPVHIADLRAALSSLGTPSQ